MPSSLDWNEMTKTKPIGFEVSISARDDGTLDAVYIQFCHRKIARTVEIVKDLLLADYSTDGRLVGIELQ
jgi:hypothetical protein